MVGQSSVRGAVSPKMIGAGLAGMLALVIAVIIFSQMSNSGGDERPDFYEQSDSGSGRETLAEGSGERGELPTNGDSAGTEEPEPETEGEDEPTTRGMAGNEEFDMEKATEEFLAAMADPDKMNQMIEEARERRRGQGRDRGGDEEDEEDDRNKPSIINGYVTTSEGQDVIGATVDALGISNTQTGDNGFYELSLSHRGSLILRVLPPDGSEYASPKPQVVIVQPGKEYRRDFTLQEGWTMEGRVVDESSQPISGATVTAFVSANVVSSTTGADGAFSIAGVPAGGIVQQIAVSHADYATATRASVSVLDGPQTFVLRSQMSARLRVVWGDGDPVTRYRYEVRPVNQQELTVISPTRPQTITSPDGTATINEISSGQWRVDVTVLDERNRETNIKNSERFVIAPGENNKEVVVEVDSGSSVSGTVVNAGTGSLVAGATVYLQPSLGSNPLFTTTGGGGSFLFETVPADSYELVAESGNLMTRDPVYLQVDSNYRGDPITLQLMEGGVIYGQVLTDEEQPSARAIVKLRLERPNFEGRQQFSYPVDSQNRYRIEGAPAGRHSIWVNYIEPDREFQEVVVEAGQEQELNFDLSDNVKLSGRVLVNGEASTDVVNILKFRAGGGAVEVRLDPEGNYEVELTPDQNYEIWARTNAFTEGKVDNLTLNAEQRELTRDINVPVVDGDFALVFPSDEDFTPGNLIINQRGAERADPLERTMEQERRRLPNMIAGEYRASFTSTDGEWMGESDWTTFQPGGENTILVEVTQSRQGVPVGLWRPDMISNQPQTYTFDLTEVVKSAGNLRVRFVADDGDDHLSISGVALQRNGQTAAQDNHSGSAGPSHSNNTYNLQLADVGQGGQLILQTTMWAAEGPDTRGTIYLDIN